MRARTHTHRYASPPAITAQHARSQAPGYLPSRIRALVENIDLYPTILDLVGVPVPPHVQGRSMKPLMINKNATSKTAVFARCRRGAGRCIAGTAP